MRLEYLTISWNLIEGLVAVVAATSAGSIALLGFGVDSFVEMSSGLVLLWRLRAEARHVGPMDVAALDRRAHRMVAASLGLLALYITVDSLDALLERREPQPTLIGVALTAVSLPLMLWLARAKRRVAHRLGSPAMESDAFQTSACVGLSVLTLVGIGLNAARGWSWADPAAALGMACLLLWEARRAWRGEACAC